MHVPPPLKHFCKPRNILKATLAPREARGFILLITEQAEGIMERFRSQFSSLQENFAVSSRDKRTLIYHIQLKSQFERTSFISCSHC